MTRKDFEAIANILRTGLVGATSDERKVLRRTAGAMCEYLSTTNPRFDRSRFMRAAGF